MADEKNREREDRGESRGEREAADSRGEGEPEMNGGDAREGAAPNQAGELGEDARTEDGPGGTDPLEAARREAAENYDRFLRARAELDNALKRHERERLDTARYAAEGLARDLLVVVDDLERALAHTTARDGSLAQGVDLVLKGMRAVLAKHGVERVASEGQPFDPALHEAVAMVETADHAPGTVIEEHRAGYRIGDRLLRPAIVVVSKAP